MLQNISDKKLCEILGMELSDYDMIDRKMEDAYAVIRKKNKENVKQKAAGNHVRKKGMRRLFIGLGSAAALFFLTFVFCMTNPVLAREIPILGSIFAKVADVFPFGKIPEEKSETLYEKESYQEETHQEESCEGSDPGYRVTDSGIAVTMEECYVTNQALFLGIRIENVEAFPEMAAYMTNGCQWLDVRTKEAYSFRSEPISSRRRIEGKFEDVHTFIGIMRIDYSELAVDTSRYYRAIEEADAKGEEYPELNNLTREEWLDYYAIPASFDMALEITQIVGTLKESTRPEGMKSDEELAQMSAEELGEYRNSLPREWVGFPNVYQHWFQDGSWQFELPITQTDTTGRIISVDRVNEAGLGVESIELSTVEMTVNTIEKTTEAMSIAVFDANGEEIEQGGNNNVYVIAGRDISSVSIYICRMSDYEKAWVEYESPENDKSLQELIEEYALFGTTVDTTF